MKKLTAILMSILMVIALSSYAFGDTQAKTLTVLFSHDMHSNVDEKIDGTGGFARVKTLINETLKEDRDTLIVDGGDFSMGTLYQSVFSEYALELRLLGLMGYDATTFGNHEFDYGADGLADMLDSARKSGDRLPYMLISNIDWDASTGAYTAQLKEAMNNFGAYEDYAIIQKGDVKVGLFGVMGEDADDCAPNSGLAFKNISESAKETVDKMIKEENPDIIVCLSHSGTSEDTEKSEDYVLAKNVPDIDIIISGHTHSTWEQPLMCGNTAIVSCGEYASNLGKIELTQTESGAWNIDYYKVIPLDKSIAQDKELLKKAEEFKALTSDYLKQFGYKGPNDVIAYSPYTFIDCETIYDQHKEHTLGNLLADSFKYAAQKAEGPSGEKIDFAVVPNGVIRSSFREGEITASNAFEVLSLGIGPDKIPGYPLIAVYLTGEEIKTACEIDASISDFMDGTMLFFTNLSFTFNPNRIILNKVTDIHIVNDDGTTEEIDDNKLYRVIADLYSGQMLGAVTDKSMGILSLTPKDKDGNPITDFNDCIIYNGDKELKAWWALAQYLESFDKKEKGLSTIPERYSAEEGRKIVDDDSSFFAIISKPNKTTLIIYAVVLLLIAIIVLIIVLIVKLHKRRKRRKAAKKEKVLRVE